MKLMRFQRPDIWNWPSYNHLTTLRDEINRLFEGPFEDGGSDAFNTWAPALDLYEDKDNLLVIAELPGLKKEDIDLAVHENTLTISGERKDVKNYEGSQTSRQERFFGKFTRSLALPKQVDSSRVKATYQDGILRVTLPKAEEAKPRQIQVKGA
jgi:HSP20 family protein